MLDIHFGPGERNRQGISRRNFLRVGSLGLGAWSLPQLLAARSMGGVAPQIDRDTSVVWFWMNGGPSQFETFDPKMNSPVEIRSVTGEVSTKLPGVTFGGTFGKLAQTADKLAVVRSFHVPNQNVSGHSSAAYHVNTGYDKREQRPSFGSILSRYRGATHEVSGIPRYAQILGRVGYAEAETEIRGPAWLGQSYGPFIPDGPGRENMTLNTTVERMEDRRTLLAKLDLMRRDADARGVMEGIDGFNRQAVDLILNDSAAAFDLSNEDPRTVARYGNDLGATMLTARRLCEAGCGFVTVSYGDWDSHSQIQGAYEKRGPQVDHALSTFIQDIYERGLDKKILLVVTGEFGRTPRVNDKGGRDHWGSLSPLMFSGGGLRVGQVIGEATANGEEPRANPYTIPDLMGTVFHHLGVPFDLHYEDPNGRPIPLLADARPIAELV